jgi:long-chain acyl-CoA synthetase
MAACSKSLVLDAGDSLNSSLVAIVAVEPEVVKAWATSEGIQVKSFSAITRIGAAAFQQVDAS